MTDVGVLLITGVMASGKSSVARELTSRFERAVLVPGDVFRRMVVTGRADPTPAFTAGQQTQLDLRYACAAATADRYAAAGFDVVVQDVALGPALLRLTELITHRPRHIVVLDPSPAVVAAREAGRTKTGYAYGWTPAAMVTDMRTSTPRLGLWLDTSKLDVTTTVDTILARLPEARVD